MSISMEELTIAIHQSALEAMVIRAARLHRQRIALAEEIDLLDDQIASKKAAISAARDAFLSRCI